MDDLYFEIGTGRLELVIGDITLQRVDAIVNAANQRLAGGGGVDGAIHRRGGPAIMADTRRRYPHGCPTGSAVISVGGDLPARHVIHAVGPRWAGGNGGEENLLQSAYRRALELAIEHACASIALPALSTGVYGYPMAEASRVALGTAIEALRSAPASFELVRFVLFDAHAHQVFAQTMSELHPPSR